MSVALLLEETLIPIATEATFYSHWQPGIDELGLEALRFMGSGVDINAGNRDAVVESLRELRRWMTMRSDYEHILKRMDRLLAHLIALCVRDGAEAWIG